METHPLSLCLFDFVPTLAFLVGGIYLFRLMRSLRLFPQASLVGIGALLVFLGGFFKATWKILYTLQVGDYQWMSQGQFVFSGLGFLALFLGVFGFTRFRRASSGATFALAAWKIPFMFVMLICSLGAEGILSYLSFRRKERLAGAAFAVGVMGLLAMGSLASAEQTLSMQWIEEIVNAVGQAGFMLGSILLHRSYARQGFK